MVEGSIGEPPGPASQLGVLGAPGTGVAGVVVVGVVVVVVVGTVVVVAGAVVVVDGAVVLDEETLLAVVGWVAARVRCLAVVWRVKGNIATRATNMMTATITTGELNPL